MHRCRRGSKGSLLGSTSTLCFSLPLCFIVFSPFLISRMIPAFPPFLRAFIVRVQDPYLDSSFSLSCVFALSTPLSCVEFPHHLPPPAQLYRLLTSTSPLPRSAAPFEVRLCALERTCRTRLWQAFFVFLPLFPTLRGFGLGPGRVREIERERENTLCDSIVMPDLVAAIAGSVRISAERSESVAPIDAFRKCEAPRSPPAVEPSR